MDYSIIAVLGTLLGVIVSAALTYTLQKQISERQHKWALEDEERHRKQLVQDEKRRLLREILFKRIDILEEALVLMDTIITASFSHACNLPPYSKDELIINQSEQRLQEILSTAWNAIVIIGSKELKEKWRNLTEIYMKVRDDYICFEDNQMATNEVIAVAKILEEMRIQD